MSPESHPTHTTRGSTRIIVCRSTSSITSVIAAHAPGTVAVLSPRDDIIGAPRTWWPLIELCWDGRLASAAADCLTRDLPPHLRLVTPEASTLLAGALHAASLVNWPIVTLTHLLDSGAVATIVELLAGADEQDFALDVASAAGPSAPEARAVIAAAALAARQLDHARMMITGPDCRDALSNRISGTGDHGVEVVCIQDDGSAVASLIIARLRYLFHTDPVVQIVEEDAA